MMYSKEKINELVQKYASVNSKYTFLKAYRAAVPQYCLNLILTFEQEKEISLVALFILKYIKCGISNIQELSKYMGVTQKTIRNAIAFLHSHDFVSLDINLERVRLTEKGEDILEKEKYIEPIDIESHHFYKDGFTGEIYCTSKKLYSSKDIREKNIKALAPEVNKPILENIDYDIVKNTLKKFISIDSMARDMYKGRFIDLKELVKSYVEYKTVYVLLFSDNDDKNRIMPYVFEESKQRNEEYESAFLRKIKIGNDYHSLGLDTKDKFVDCDNFKGALIDCVSDEVKKEVERYKDKADEITQSIRKSKKEIENLSENVDASIDYRSKLKELEAVIKKQEAELKHSDRPITNTYEHRDILLRSFSEAENQIIIVSPWIKYGGMNDDVISLMTEALIRGVNIIIGYGINEEDHGNDQRILRRLDGIRNSNYKGKLTMINSMVTHEKVLIVDNKYSVITSYNWLSFGSNPNWGYRQETGIYSESQKVINNLKESLRERMKIDIY